MNYLDDGVLVEILVRLPARSLLRFKCVDRRWNSLISDPRFVKAQARLSSSNTSQRLILRDKRGHISVSFEDLMNGWREDSAMRLDGLHIIGSCHGLLWLHQNPFVLYNPATMMRRELRRPPFIFKLKFVRGLGYDVLNDDYKLVVANHYSQCGWDFHVFSLRSPSWRRIGGLRTDIQDCQGKYSNGFLHWLRGVYGGILSFDVATEQLHIDMLPRPVFTHPGCFTQLGVTECGWLIIYRDSPYASEFWIMKDPCRGSTWTKLCYFEDERLKYDLSYRLWFPWVRNGKIFLCRVLGKKCDRISVYDPEKKYLKTIQVPENHSPIFCLDSISHVLNLLPPHV